MRNDLKVIMAGGGTAGHINPALSVAEIIQKLSPNADILFVGTKRGIESDLVVRKGYRIRYIQVRGFERKLSLNTIRSIISLAAGLIQAHHLLRKEKPDLVVGTGGYVAGPVLFIAALRRIPTLLHEQNVIPGITNRILSGQVDVCAVSFEDSLLSFPKAKRTVLTGNPIRKELLETSREEARKKLGLKDSERMVVVMGGSLGARNINHAMIHLIRNRYRPEDFRLVYAPGKRFFEEVSDAIRPVPEGIDLREYIYDAETVYNACDLIVSRSGAMTVSEITALGIPSILIPSSYVAENHQEPNARSLEKRQACKVILDGELNGDLLYDMIKEVLKEDAVLEKMRENARNASIRDAVEQITLLIREMLEGVTP